MSWNYPTESPLTHWGWMEVVTTSKQLWRCMNPFFNFVDKQKRWGVQSLPKECALQRTPPICFFFITLPYFWHSIMMLKRNLSAAWKPWKHCYFKWNTVYFLLLLWVHFKYFFLSPRLKIALQLAFRLQNVRAHMGTAHTCMVMHTHMPTYKSSARKPVITKPNAAARVNTRQETMSVKRRVGVCVGVAVFESTESVFPQVQDLEKRIYKSTMCPWWLKASPQI